jgi:hypothetical protein
MEVGQGPNWGCSAIGKKNSNINSTEWLQMQKYFNNIKTKSGDHN